MSEEWREIDEFPGYFVSDHGRVRSPHRGFLKGCYVSRNGRPRYVMITFKPNGKLHQRYLHRLVLIAFVGPCPEGMEGCHGPAGPFVNHLENLRWDTHKSNMQDAIEAGTFFRPEGFQKGNRFGRSRFAESVA